MTSNCLVDTGLQFWSMASLRSFFRISNLFDLHGSVSLLAFLTGSKSKSGKESAYDVLLEVVVGLLVDGLVEGLVEVDVTVTVEESKFACGTEGWLLREEPPPWPPLFSLARASLHLASAILDA